MKKLYFKHYDKRLVNYYWVNSKGERCSAMFQEVNKFPIKPTTEEK